MRPTRPIALLGAMLLAVVACSTDTPEDPDQVIEQQLAQLRTNTSRYLEPKTAMAAGWSAIVSDCMSDPARGGMGVHYADVARIDTTLDVQRPEILVYEPRHGALTLVAVEYAVPIEQWHGTQPPSLFGRRFHANEQFGLWVLHAWVQKPNPAGVFSEWNANVVCPTMSGT